MSHIFTPHTPATVYVPTPTTPSVSDVVTPTQAPVTATTPSKGGTTPSFLGSSVLPPTTASGSATNEKKLLGS